jgi:uncharacterized protein YjbI with pentapeptide repeats
MIRGGCLLMLALLVAATGPAAGRAAPNRLDGAAIARELRGGETVIATRAVVDGRLDLAGTEVVRGVFRCRECRFDGPLSAPDVTFARTVDLTGSTFVRAVDFRGTTFRGPALFRAAPVDGTGVSAADPGARFLRGADFSLAVFDDFASFKGADFRRTARFQDARFADATFVDTTFESALFDGASFRGAARFIRSAFARAAMFGDVDFGDRANFSLSVFDGGAVFTGAHFAAGASFLAAGFAPSRTAEAARLQFVTSAGDLDFTFAQFPAAGDPSSVLAVFSDLVCSRSLVLRDVRFPDAGHLLMDRLQVRDLVMAIDAVALVDPPAEQRRVLETIEESAKARDDLATANDAHYRLRVIQSDDYGAMGHAMDYVFYRGVAGYFVRPLRPLLVLVALVLLLSIARELRSGRPPGVEGRSRVRRVASGARQRGERLVAGVLNAFALIGPRRGGDEPPVSRRLEAFAYRLLAVCALLGLAASNPTLRQMVDTLF